VVAKSLSAEPVMPAPATTSQQAKVHEVKSDQAKRGDGSDLVTAQLDLISKRTSCKNAALIKIWRRIPDRLDQAR
jgi:hypothetical protein